MAKFRNVFFSFHYEDVMLASQIRNCEQFLEDRMGFRDWAAWEQVKLRSDKAIASWIDDQLEGTSVTVVLIGNETATRKWVHYEIIRSVSRGNGLIGIYTNRMSAPRHSGDGPRGENPFGRHKPRSENFLMKALADVGLQSSADADWRKHGLVGSAMRAHQEVRSGGLLGVGATPAPAFGEGLLGTAQPSTWRGMVAPPRPSSALGLAGLGHWAHSRAPTTLSDQVRAYCWQADNGHYNFGNWIERAAREVGR